MAVTATTATTAVYAVIGLVTTVDFSLENLVPTSDYKEYCKPDN